MILLKKCDTFQVIEKLLHRREVDNHFIDILATQDTCRYTSITSKCNLILLYPITWFRTLVRINQAGSHATHGTPTIMVRVNQARPNRAPMVYF